MCALAPACSFTTNSTRATAPHFMLYPNSNLRGER